MYKRTVKKTAVSTITQIRDAIEKIHIKSPPQNYQSQQINPVNKTHLTLATTNKLTAIRILKNLCSL